MKAEVWLIIIALAFAALWGFEYVIEFVWPGGRHRAEKPSRVGRAARRARLRLRLVVRSVALVWCLVRVRFTREQEAG